MEISRLRVKLKNDTVAIRIEFNSKQERDLNFDLVKTSMSKASLDVWYSETMVIKISEISYIEKID